MTDLRELFVGGLPPDADETEVRELFARFSAVHEVTLIRDAVSGASRGFGFVKVPQATAQAAIDGLDGLELREYRVRVNESRDKGAPAPRRRF